MSKTKKIKQKTTGFDILFRVITVILGVAIFPVAYFQKMFTLIVYHGDILGGTIFNKSVSELKETYNTYFGMFGKLDNASEIAKNHDLIPLYIAVGLFLLALVMALAFILTAVFSNKASVVAGLSLAGIVFMIASYVTFTFFFARPLINGTIDLASLLGISGIANLFFSGLMAVKVFKLEGAFFSVLFLMLAVFIWAAAVLVVNASEEKSKKQAVNKKAKNK